MSNELKIKKYSEIEIISIIKDLLGLMVNDKKRFPTLVNKFKKSIAKIDSNDGRISKIDFNNVSLDVISEELQNAINGTLNYFSRSEKKLKELKIILKLEEGQVETLNKKQLKEIKPKLNSNGKSSVALEKIDLSIKNFIIGLKDDDVIQLIADTEKAFEKDSRISVTMKNHQKNYENPRDAAIAMFNTAYTRKPNNRLMSNWYSKFVGKKIKEVKKSTKTTKSAKTTKTTKTNNISKSSKITKITKVKEPSITKEKLKASPSTKTKITKEVKVTKDIKSIESTHPKEELTSFQINVYPYVLNNVVLPLKSNITLRFNKETKSTLKVQEDELVSYFIETKVSDIDYNVEDNDKLFVIENYLEAFKDISLDIEANLLSNSITNCITTTVTQNLITILANVPGFKDPKIRTLCLTKIGELLEVTENLNYENIKTKYLNLIFLSQLEIYLINRKILKILLENLDTPTKLLLFEFIGEIILNSLMVGKSLSLIHAPFKKITKYGKEDKAKEEKSPETNENIETNETNVNNENSVEVEENKKVESNNPKIKYTLTANELVFVFRERSNNISKLDPKFNDIYKAVIENDYTTLDKLIETKESIINSVKQALNTENIRVNLGLENVGEIKIVDKKILCGNKIFSGLITKQFVEFLNTNNTKQINSLKNFIYRASLNPSEKSVSELYDFIISNNLLVTPAGTILLYKWVQDNYLDTHSKTFLNKPGMTLRMPREKVNANRNETCSNGLHLCSWKYGSFGTRLLLCELDPKNVVSIPSDYNQSKMRCHEYTVIMDITEFKDAFNKMDYLSKTENLHYNPIMIEIDLMTNYPTIKRKNSIIGFNDISGGDENFKRKCKEIIKDIDLNEEIESVKVVSEVTEVVTEELAVAEDTKIAEEVAVAEDTEEGKTEVVSEVVTEELTEVEDSPKEEFKKQEQEINPDMITDEIKNSLIALIEKGEINSILLDNLGYIFENYIKFGLDNIIIDNIKFVLGETYIKKVTSREEALKMYRKLYISSHSSSLNEQNDYDMSESIAPSKVTENTDKVEVLITPTNNIVEKVSKFFKKLLK